MLAFECALWKEGGGASSAAAADGRRDEQGGLGQHKHSNGGSRGPRCEKLEEKLKRPPAPLTLAALRPAARSTVTSRRPSNAASRKPRLVYAVSVALTVTSLMASPPAERKMGRDEGREGRRR